MVLLKKFRKSKDDDYENMSSITGSLRIVLQAMGKGLIPHEQYSMADVISLCKSLISNQESNGSWPVHKPGYVVEEEDVVDFIFFPTQIASSILSYVKQNLNCSELDGLDNAISLGLKFSVSNKLEGFGHNSMFQKLESLIIFTEGSVAALLNQDPRICPPLYHRLIELREELQGIVDSGNTKMAFGGDYREQYEFVLKGLEGI